MCTPDKLRNPSKYLMPNIINTSDLKELFRIRRILYLSILLFCTSCEKTDISYFPLKPYLYWHYDINKVTVIGKSNLREIISNQGSRKTSEGRLFVQKSITGIESLYDVSSSGINLKLRLTSEGKPLERDMLPGIVFNYPLNVGTQWRDSVSTSMLKSYDPRARDIRETIELDVSVQSINETVRIPFGKFKNCIRTFATGNKHVQKGQYAYQPDMNITVEITRWYAPGVGLIKETQIENTGILQYPTASLVKTLTRFQESG